MAYVAYADAPATGDAAFRAIKDRWVSIGAFAHMNSGDGASAYASGGADVITADSGANSFATSGAWWRGRQAGGTREILLKRGASSTTWTVQLSVGGLFTGGSPSATAAPTATDAVTLWNNAQLLPTDGSYKLAICADSAAPYYTGASWIVTGGTCRGGLHLCSLTAGSYPNTGTAATSDEDPWVYVCDYHATTALMATRLGLLSSDFSAGSFSAGGWYKYNKSGSGFKAASFVGVHGRTAGDSYLAFTNLLGVNAISGEGLPGRALVALSGSANAYFGPKGDVADLRLCFDTSAQSPHGKHIRTTADGRYWVRMGDLWVPWDSTTPTF